MISCFQNCSDVLWEKFVLMTEKKIQAKYLFKQWNVSTIFETVCFFTCARRFLGLQELQFKLKKNNWDLETYRKMVWLKSHIILPEWLSLVILSHEPIVLWHVVWVLAFDWRRLWEPLILWLWSLSWVHAFYHGRQLLVVGAIWQDFLEAEIVNLK